MRWILVLWIALQTTACGVDPIDDASPAEAEAAQAATVRSALERNFDTLLRANQGSACSTDSTGTTCVVNRAVQPARNLRPGDPIPASAALRLCAPGGGCIAIPPPPAAGVFCPSLALCAPLAVGCPTGGSLQCTPSPGPFGGINLHCHCEL